MDEKELTEVPLSNEEVLKVLKARTSREEHPRTLDMITYLETIKKGSYKYPLEVLRNLKTTKNLEAELTTLAVVSNISDTSILSASDKKLVEQHFAKN
jgi:hypothetical protein